MKKYLASWDGEYYDEGKTEIHTMDWFSDERGYEEESISKIKELKVGQSVEIEKGHIVTRISPRL